MIMNFSNPRDVFSENLDGIALPLIGQCAAQLHDPILHIHIESAFWRPALMLRFLQNAAAYLRVRGSALLVGLCDETSQRPDKIRTRDNSHELVSIHDRKTFDPALLHQRDGRF